MLYLLDANVLIRAHEDFYPIDRVPQFWDWLEVEAKAGHIKMPFEIHDEIAISNGPLKEWCVDSHIKDVLVLDEEVDQSIFQHVLEKGYAPDLTDAELDQIGRDPFLIAYALVGGPRTVVTKEVSRPSKTRARRKVPDVCTECGGTWMTDFALYRARNFHIPK